jgi:hypothetical protein
MKKVIKLTEADLVRLVERVIRERDEKKPETSDRFLGFHRNPGMKWYDETKSSTPEDFFDFEYDEDEFDDYDTFASKVGVNPWIRVDMMDLSDPLSDDADLSSSTDGREWFNNYVQLSGPLKLRTRRKM